VMRRPVENTMLKYGKWHELAKLSWKVHVDLAALDGFSNSAPPTRLRAARCQALQATAQKGAGRGNRRTRREICRPPTALMISSFPDIGNGLPFAGPADAVAKLGAAETTPPLHSAHPHHFR